MDILAGLYSQYHSLKKRFNSLDMNKEDPAIIKHTADALEALENRLNKETEKKKQRQLEKETKKKESESVQVEAKPEEKPEQVCYNCQTNPKMDCKECGGTGWINKKEGAEPMKLGPGETETEHWMTDKDIASEYEDYEIYKEEATSSNAGFFSMHFPSGKEDMYNSFVIYDDGKVAFDHWMPDFMYLDLAHKAKELVSKWGQKAKEPVAESAMKGSEWPKCSVEGCENKADDAIDGKRYCYKHLWGKKPAKKTEKEANRGIGDIGEGSKVKALRPNTALGNEEGTVEGFILKVKRADGKQVQLDVKEVFLNEDEELEGSMAPVKESDMDCYAADEMVEPVKGTPGSKGRVIRHDGPGQNVFIAWEEGKLKDAHGFGAYDPKDVRRIPKKADVETDPNEPSGIGYGGDRPGVNVAPLRDEDVSLNSGRRYALKQDLAFAKKGSFVTAIKIDAKRNELKFSTESGIIGWASLSKFALEEEAARGVPGSVFTAETAPKVLEEIKAGVKAPYVNGTISTLGGKDNVSIMLTIAKEPKEAWKNGILENSTYGKFDISNDGTIEQHSGGLPFRKTVAKDAADIIAKLNRGISSVQPTASLNKLAYVVHRSDGWHVLSEKGKNLGGPYKSKEQAVKRLRQVEYFKHHGSLKLSPRDLTKIAEPVDPAVESILPTLEDQVQIIRDRMDSFTNSFEKQAAKESEADTKTILKEIEESLEVLEKTNIHDEKNLAQIETIEHKIFELEEKFNMNPAEDEEHPVEASVETKSMKVKPTVPAGPGFTWAYDAPTDTWFEKTTTPGLVV